MALKVKCISKNRDSKGNIVNYNLVDETGNQFQATGKQIKAEMQSDRYEFINLQIDKAGRLVDKAEPKESKESIQKPHKQVVVTEDAVKKAVGELGNLMLKGQNIQCRTQYARENKDCIVEFNIRVNPVLIQFLQERRGAGEEYIRQELVKQFNRNLYTINGFNALNFSKEQLHYDLTPEEVSKGITYHCYYFTPENLRNMEANSKFMKHTYMDNDFQIVDTKIKFVPQKKEVEQPEQPKLREHYKGSSPKEVVKNFLATMNERYDGDDDGKQFEDDFNGCWWKVKGEYEEEMPKEVKVYFQTLVDSLVKKATEDRVLIYNDFENLPTIEEVMKHSELSEVVVKFQEKTKCDIGVIYGLFNLAKQQEKSKLAWLKITDTVVYGWEYDNIILTANRDKIEKYIDGALQEIKGMDESINYEAIIVISADGNAQGLIWYEEYLKTEKISKYMENRLNLFEQAQIKEKIERKIEDIKKMRASLLKGEVFTFEGNRIMESDFINVSENFLSMKDYKLDEDADTIKVILGSILTMIHETEEKFDETVYIFAIEDKQTEKCKGIITCNKEACELTLEVEEENTLIYTYKFDRYTEFVDDAEQSFRVEYRADKDGIKKNIAYLVDID